MATERDLCCFKNLQVDRNGPIILARNLNKSRNTTTFSFIETQGATNDKCELDCSREEINFIRSNLGNLLTSSHRSIWFVCSIKPAEPTLENHKSNPGKTQSQRSSTVLYNFGSMISYDTFVGHMHDNRYPANIRMNKDTRGRPKSMILQRHYTTYRMVLDLSMLHADILIKHGQENQNEPVQMVFMLKGPPRFEQQQLETGEYLRICNSSQHVLNIDVISHCSDLWVQFKDRRDAWDFLQQLQASNHIKQFIANFAEFQFSQSSNGSNLPFALSCNIFASELGDYGMRMLWSLGYVFIDKYMNNIDLQAQFVSHHQKSSTKFYDLCCSLWKHLQEDHCYIIRNIFEDPNIPVCAPTKGEYQVPHAIVTPLRTLFQPLHLSMGHRAMRQHGDNKSGFKWMLVYIRDEDGVSKMTKINGNAEVRERYKMILQNGLSLPSLPNDDLMYCYFGSSGSQSKKQEFWFMAPINIKSADAPAKVHEVRARLGDLKSIQNIPTYIARVGLYLTTSKPTDIKLAYLGRWGSSETNILSGILSFFTIPKWLKSPVPDLKNKAYLFEDIEHNGYCFTDGVGQISLGLAREVAKAIGISADGQDIPSAYQVRVAGCKGMLSIDPVSTENDHYIKVRKSMMKFKSDDWTLEIVDHSRIMCLSLNNQVIRLLYDLNPDNRAVIESLQNRCILQGQWHPPEETYLNVFDSQNTDRIKDYQRRNGYLNAKDFLRRNRIPLPVDEARGLFGIADETKSLQEGQCFIQYQKMNKKSYTVVTGTVLVTKNPCLYPGDIRRLEAVDIPALRSCIRDCIVFPVHGSRPHSNEIAGSDLDGDIYWVYWGTELTIKEMIPPLAYTPASKKTVPIVTLELIINHILDALDDSTPGTISNTHAVIADRAEGGTTLADCRYLAELFPRAIDSIKTGEQINMEKVMQLRDKWCNAYPTWMMKSDKQKYDSGSINEYLFKKSAQLKIEGLNYGITFRKYGRINRYVSISMGTDNDRDEQESPRLNRRPVFMPFCSSSLQYLIRLCLYRSYYQ